MKTRSPKYLTLRVNTSAIWYKGDHALARGRWNGTATVRLDVARRDVQRERSESDDEGVMRGAYGVKDPWD